MAEEQKRMGKDPMVTPPADKPRSDDQEESAVDKVFSNDTLREKILKEVIYSPPASSASRASGDREINYADLPKIRLVQKSWLLSTSRILHENRHPLFHLHNLDSIHLFIANNQEHKKLISSYIQTINPPPTNLEPVLPTFKLSLICAVFIAENHRILAKLLKKCGSELVSLVIIIPKCCTMPFTFPPYSLPILQRLDIEFVNHFHGDPRDQDQPLLRKNTRVVPFLHRLIKSCSELKSVEFKSSLTSSTTSLIPFGFELLSLPRTVNTFLLQGAFTRHHLDLIFPRYHVAHLKKVTLSAAISSPILDSNAIQITLQRHAGTLQVLELSGEKYLQHDNQPSMFNIPAMQNLEEITISSPNWRCVKGLKMRSSDFPNLTTFRMNGISGDLFEMLTARGRGEGGRNRRVKLKFVKKLQIWLINQRNGYMPMLRQETMQNAHRSFRNVTCLEITICGKECSGMRYIFTQMGKLECLAINIIKYSGGGDEYDLTCEEVDNLLIGRYENMSILKLPALSKLTLATKGMPVIYLPGGEVRNRLLSDVSFDFAFLNMQELRILKLYGRFQPTRRMIRVWNNMKVKNGLGEPLVYGLIAEVGI